MYFLNPLDVSEYLATANITTQTAFGMNYIEDFLRSTYNIQIRAMADYLAALEARAVMEGVSL